MLKNRAHLAKNTKTTYKMKKYFSYLKCRNLGFLKDKIEIYENNTL